MSPSVALVKIIPVTEEIKMPIIQLLDTIDVTISQDVDSQMQHNLDDSNINSIAACLIRQILEAQENHNFLELAHCINGFIEIAQRYPSCIEPVDDAVKENLLTRVYQMQVQAYGLDGQGAPYSNSVAARRDLAASRQRQQQRLDDDATQTLEFRQENNQIAKDLLEQFAQTGVASLGEPPCRWALASLGSLSRNDRAPYSDVEYTLLIDFARVPQERHRAVKEYFKRLDTLIKLQVINLGETPRFFGRHQVMAQGFQVDSVMNPACDDFAMLTSPEQLARLGVCDFLTKSSSFKTMEAFSQYIEENLNSSQSFEYWVEGDFPGTEEIRATVLQSLSLVTGDAQLVDEFFSHRDTLYHYPLPHDPSTSLSQVMGLWYLREMQSQFAPSNHPRFTRDAVGMQQVFDAKSDFYRYCERSIAYLSMYYGIRSGDTQQRIDTLLENGHLSPNTANRFTRALEISYYFRNKAQLFNASESEDIDLGGNPQGYQASQRDCQLILELHQILLPLERATGEFIASRGQSMVFAEHDLWDEPLIEQAQALFRMGDIDKARTCFHILAKLDSSEDESVRCYPKNYFLQLAIDAEHLNDKKAYLQIACHYHPCEETALMLQALAKAYFADGLLQDAKDCHQSALECCHAAPQTQQLIESDMRMFKRGFHIRDFLYQLGEIEQSLLSGNTEQAQNALIENIMHCMGQLENRQQKLIIQAKAYTLQAKIYLLSAPFSQACIEETINLINDTLEALEDTPFTPRIKQEIEQECAKVYAEMHLQLANLTNTPKQVEKHLKQAIKWAKIGYGEAYKVFGLYCIDAIKRISEMQREGNFFLQQLRCCQSLEYPGNNLYDLCAAHRQAIVPTALRIAA